MLTLFVFVAHWFLQVHKSVLVLVYMQRDSVFLYSTEDFFLCWILEIFTNPKTFSKINIFFLWKAWRWNATNWLPTELKYNVNTWWWGSYNKIKKIFALNCQLKFCFLFFQYFEMTYGLNIEVHKQVCFIKQFKSIFINSNARFFTSFLTESQILLRVDIKLWRNFVCYLKFSVYA